MSSAGRNYNNQFRHTGTVTFKADNGFVFVVQMPIVDIEWTKASDFFAYCRY